MRGLRHVVGRVAGEPEKVLLALQLGIRLHQVSHDMPELDATGCRGCTGNAKVHRPEALVQLLDAAMQTQQAF